MGSNVFATFYPDSSVMVPVQLFQIIVSYMGFLD